MKIFKKLTAVILAIGLISSLSLYAFADSVSYAVPSLDVTVTLPEDTYIFDSSVSSLDQSWTLAGLESPTDYLDLYTDLNIYAHFSSNGGADNVYVSKTDTDTTQSYFSFATMSEEELNAIVEEYTTVEDTGYINATLTYANDIPFITLDIYSEMTDGTIVYERATFTILNGYTVSFSINSDTELTQSSIDFLDSIYQSAEFTYIIEQEETDLTSTEAVLIVVGFFALMIMIISFFVKISIDSKKANKKTKLLADKISIYRKNTSENPSLDRKLIFQNSTILSDKLIKNYSLYQCYLKRAFTTAFSIIVTAACCIIASMMSFDWWIVALFFAALAFCVFQVALSGSKLQKSLKRVHSKYLSKKAVYKFYESDFSVSGIQYLEYFAYFQITEFKEYKDEFYLYFGPTNCLFVSKNGFTVAEEQDFKAFINRKMKEDKIPK